LFHCFKKRFFLPRK